MFALMLGHLYVCAYIYIYTCIGYLARSKVTPRSDATGVCVRVRVCVCIVVCAYGCVYIDYVT